MVAVAIPLTFQTMKTYPFVFAERDFTAAIDDGKKLDALKLDANQRLADYVTSHVSDVRQVQVDDAQTFMPILLSGRPDLFFDRIDLGDNVWHQIAGDPEGQVGWMMMPKQQGPIPDQLLACYPGAPSGKLDFLRPVASAGGTVLLRVVRPPGTTIAEANKLLNCKTPA